MEFAVTKTKNDLMVPLVDWTWWRKILLLKNVSIEISKTERESKSSSHSVMSNSLWPHALEPTGLLCQWNAPGKNTGVGCHSLLQGMFRTRGSNPGLLHCRHILYHLSHEGSPKLKSKEEKDNIQELWYNYKRCNICVMRLPKSGQLGGTGGPGSLLPTDTSRIHLQVEKFSQSTY